MDGERPWSPADDHARFARYFAERDTTDERLLSTLELHDEPYWIWRAADAPEPQLLQLMARLPDPDLFARFVELDAANEGKDLTFLWWFRRELALAGLLPVHATAPSDGDHRDVVYVKVFATTPEPQPGITQPPRSSSPSSAVGCKPTRRSFTSDDGLPVELRWRWRGSRRELIERDADVIRRALAVPQSSPTLRPTKRASSGPPTGPRRWG